MKKKLFIFTFIILIFSIFSFFYYKENNDFIIYEANLKNDKVRFYWKDENGNNYFNFLNLKEAIKNKNEELIFATNGGMYKKDASPQGLYIENGETKTYIDTTNGNGNFYLKPNGVFYITKDKKASIFTTKKFKNNEDVLYATQSGPMLVIEGKVHPAFKENSQNVNIRNGVGILPNGNVIFVMSKKKINFYDFAKFFKKQNCKSALYLDGFVSRTYFPKKKWEQVDGNFGVIIGVSK